MRIMMSAAASPTAYSIIKHLQGLGHEVIGHDSSVHTRSAADRHFRSPPATDKAYLGFIGSFEPSYDMYLPFLDEELQLFCSYGGPAKCLCSSKKTLIDFSHKDLQAMSLERAGFKTPPEVEVIVKPTFGRGGKGLYTLKSNSEFVVQKRVKGMEYTIDTLTDLDGKFLFAVPRKRLVANSVSLVGQIDMDSDLIDMARAVTEKFKFAGPINIQVMVSAAEDYIIEVNPRLSGSCMFTVMAGFDILEASIAVFEGRPFVPPAGVEQGCVIARRYHEEFVRNEQ